MLHIRFTFGTTCEDPEPNRLVPRLYGEIFQYVGDPDNKVKIGTIDANVFLRCRAMDEGVDTYHVMDSVDSTLFECFEAVLDPEIDDWSESLHRVYRELWRPEVLYIREIKLDENYRGKGIGAMVVKEVVALFGSFCGLIVCKPFPFQYAGWQDEDEEHTKMRNQPGFEEKRQADFAKVARFWTRLGFRQLPDSDFCVFSTETLPEVSDRVQ